VTTRILLRISGREDVVLDLRPGHFHPVSLRAGHHGPIGHFSVLLIEDETGDVTPEGIRLPESQPAVVEQPDLLGGTS
jgi:hypothetical protein